MLFDHYRIREPTVIMDLLHYSSVTNFSPSSWITLFLSGACPLFFCLTGKYPSRIFKRCSAIFRGTPVISADFQAKISKFCLSKEHSSLRPFSLNVDLMATVLFQGWMLGPEIIAHSIGMNLLLCNVTVPPSTGNFNIPCAVDALFHNMTSEGDCLPNRQSITLCTKVSPISDFDDHWPSSRFFHQRRERTLPLSQERSSGYLGLGHSFHG
ncbi:hypothetical protein Tco_0190706 [Tanacetum coccineum]